MSEAQSKDSVDIESIAQMHAPAAAALVMADRVRAEIAAQLRSRADWLRSEYMASGQDLKRVRAREEECRYLAEKIEQGLTP